MNKLYLIAIGALLSGIITVQAQEWKPQQWPVLKKYDKEHLSISKILIVARMF